VDGREEEVTVNLGYLSGIDIGQPKHIDIPMQPERAPTMRRREPFDSIIRETGTRSDWLMARPTMVTALLACLTACQPSSGITYAMPDEHPRTAPSPPRGAEALTLRQADQARTDFAAIESNLEFIMSQLAGIPTRRLPKSSLLTFDTQSGLVSSPPVMLSTHIA
jgi:hypothetical protein